jgi:hypothetical protein
MAPKAATPSGPGSQAPATLKAPSAAQSHFAKLEGQKKNGRAIWWRSFVPKIVTDSSGAEQVVLECDQCSAQLSSSNPSGLCAPHYNMHQKRAAKVADDVAAASQAGALLSQSGMADNKRQRTESGQQPVYAFLASRAQALAVLFCL